MALTGLTDLTFLKNKIIETLASSELRTKVETYRLLAENTRRSKFNFNISKLTDMLISDYRSLAPLSEVIMLKNCSSSILASHAKIDIARFLLALLKVDKTNIKREGYFPTVAFLLTCLRKDLITMQQYMQNQLMRNLVAWNTIEPVVMYYYCTFNHYKPLLKELITHLSTFSEKQLSSDNLVGIKKDLPYFYSSFVKAELIHANIFNHLKQNNNVKSLLKNAKYEMAAIQGKVTTDVIFQLQQNIALLEEATSATDTSEKDKPVLSFHVSLTSIQISNEIIQRLGVPVLSDKEKTIAKNDMVTKYATFLSKNKALSKDVFHSLSQFCDSLSFYENKNLHFDLTLKNIHISIRKINILSIILTLAGQHEENVMFEKDDPNIAICHTLWKHSIHALNTLENQLFRARITEMPTILSLVGFMLQFYHTFHQYKHLFKQLPSYLEHVSDEIVTTSFTNCEIHCGMILHRLNQRESALRFLQKSEKELHSARESLSPDMFSLLEARVNQLSTFLYPPIEQIEETTESTTKTKQTEDIPTKTPLVQPKQKNIVPNESPKQTPVLPIEETKSDTFTEHYQTTTKVSSPYFPKKTTQLRQEKTKEIQKIIAQRKIETESEKHAKATKKKQEKQTKITKKTEATLKKQTQRLAQLSITEEEKDSCFLSTHSPLNLRPVYVPDSIKTLMMTLKNNGFQILIYGGYIRDHLFEKPSKDIDLVVPCSDPNALAENLHHYHYTQQRIQTESSIITLFTIQIKDEISVDMVCTDKPIHHFLKNVDSPLNGLICCEQGNIYDLHDFYKHFFDKYLTMVGKPEERIPHNLPIILRFIRLSQFKPISPNILGVMQQFAHQIPKIPLKTYLRHIEKLFLREHAVDNLCFMIEHNLFPHIIPTFMQNEIYYFQDFWTSQLSNIEKMDPIIKQEYTAYHILGLFFAPAAKPMLSIFCDNYLGECTIPDRIQMKKATASVMEGYHKEYLAHIDKQQYHASSILYQYDLNTQQQPAPDAEPSIVSSANKHAPS